MNEEPNNLSIASPIDYTSPEITESVLPTINKITEIDNILKEINKTWTELKKAKKELDLRTWKKNTQLLETQIPNLIDLWSQHQIEREKELETAQNFLASPDYPIELEASLKQQGIPLSAEFPVYEIPPFKLNIDTPKSEIKLSIGRKMIDKTNILAPQYIAQWVAKHYQKIIKSKFNSEQICKELLAAYEIVNCIQYQNNTPLWGQPVELKEIYRILTITLSARQDYPQPLFSFNLARLKEQFDISYKGHTFEFVANRNSAKNWILVDTKKREHQVGDLIIYSPLQ